MGAQKECTGCQICGSARGQQLVCSSCFCKGAVAERVQALTALQAKKEALLARLNTAVQAQERRVALEQLQREKLLSLRTASQQAALARQRLREVQRRSADVEASTAMRKASVDASTAELENVRSALLNRVLPESLHQRMVHLAMLQEQIALVQPVRIQSLLEILPLTVAALRPTRLGRGSAALSTAAGRGEARAGREAGQTPVVTLAGLRLPDNFWPDVDELPQAQALSTALGYTALLLQLVSSYLDAPLLHVIGFQGSTSELWLPRSFFDDGPPAQAARHRLHVQNMAASTVPASAVVPASSPASTAMYSLASLTQHWETFKTSASGSNPALQRPTRRQSEDLATALRLLWVSAGAVVGSAAWRLPSDWNPLATLAVMLQHLASSPGSQRRSSLHPSVARSVLTLKDLPAELLPALEALAQEQVEGESDEDVDGWDMIRRPLAASTAAGTGSQSFFLPPPPSQGANVQDWERAMFTDSNSAYLAQNYQERRGVSLPPAARATLDQLSTLSAKGWTGLAALYNRAPSK